MVLKTKYSNVCRFMDFMGLIHQPRHHNKEILFYFPISAGWSFIFIHHFLLSFPFKGKKLFSLRLIENKDLCTWVQLDSICCDRNDFNSCLFEYVWTLSMFMYLAFIGRVRISSPTPSTSTTSDSWYVLTVLEHSVTCTNITQTYNKTTNTPIHRQDNKCLRLKAKK